LGITPKGEYFFKTILSLSKKISTDSPSFILSVFLISLGITILPKSSILLTTPVVFIKQPHFHYSYFLPNSKNYSHFSLILHYIYYNIDKHLFFMIIFTNCYAKIA